MTRTELEAVNKDLNAEIIRLRSENQDLREQLQRMTERYEELSATANRHAKYLSEAQESIRKLEIEIEEDD